MSSTRDLEQLAWEHSIFPLIQIEDLKQRGPMIYVEGEGIGLADANGNIYLDMMGSHSRANSLGYGNEEIARAVYEQMRTLHYVGTVANLAEPTIRLSSKIASLAPGALSRVVYVSGGSEAVETAIKLAKQYHIAVGRKPRAHKIISPLECLPRRHHGRSGRDRLAGHAAYLGTGRTGIFLHSGSGALPQSVWHVR